MSRTMSVSECGISLMDLHIKPFGSLQQILHVIQPLCTSTRKHRYCGAEKRARPKSVGPMMDFSCDEADKGLPVQMHSLREFEQEQQLQNVRK
ncbi:hypothetical protein EXN66_Car006154 [Channa argus]|uniref:Uncharacterized protein n=1 Tax=Channa argus TaxID=215402 RepID=A0A6G1PJH0_CHAAH|nr:hypothetical protein EXN66_Car006154 [Channa argus]